MKNQTVLALCVPELQRPPVAEPHAASPPWMAAALDAAMDRISGATFVVSGSERVVHANSPGRTLLQMDPQGTRARILKAEHRTRLAALPHYELIVLEESGPDAAPRVRVLAAAWGLTPREAAVLEVLAEGRSNKCIAAVLGCAEKTVEVHVSRVLYAADCDSRAALVARFWTTRIVG
jgi:DNA-binding CsgD family transcriptional regulator